MTRSAKMHQIHENRDPLTGEPGSHPVATTIGATAGIGAGVAAAIATGAATGALAGPGGVILGAIAGGIFGGGVGHALGEDLYPTQLAWWKENYRTRPYVTEGVEFSEYEPAYWYGIDAYASNPGLEFDNLEPSLRNNWNIGRGRSTLTWEAASPTARDAHTRVRELQRAKK